MMKTRITALGTKGSGKTCYMLGMYHTLKSGDQFLFTADADTQVELDDKYKNIYGTQINRHFPVGTDQNDDYVFKACHEYNSFMDIQYLDYAGGALESKLAGNVQEYQKIEQSISNSDALLIFVDGKLLVEGTPEEKVARVKEKCAGVINSFIIDYVQKKQKLPPICIVLTKADEFKHVETSEILEITRAAFSGLFSQEHREKQVGIVNVTLFSKPDKELPTPERMEHPIFFGMKYAFERELRNSELTIRTLQRKKSELEQEAKKLQDEIDNYIKTSLTSSRNIEVCQKNILEQKSRFWGGKKKIIEENALKIKQCQQLIDNNKKSIISREKQITEIRYNLKTGEKTLQKYIAVQRYTEKLKSQIVKKLQYEGLSAFYVNGIEQECIQ